METGAGLTFALASSSPLLLLSLSRGSPGDTLETKHRGVSVQDEEPLVTALSSEGTAGVWLPSTGTRVPASRRSAHGAGLSTLCPPQSPADSAPGQAGLLGAQGLAGWAGLAQGTCSPTLAVLMSRCATWAGPGVSTFRARLGAGQALTRPCCLLASARLRASWPEH